MEPRKEAVAVARPPAVAPYRDPAPEGFDGVTMGTTRFNRNGLFLHGAIGATYLAIFRSSETTASDPFGTSAFTGTSNIETFPVQVEVAVGGGLKRDLALALILRLARASSANLRTADGPRKLEDGLSTSFLGLGIFSHMGPDSGVMLGAAAGFEAWRSRASETDEGEPEEIGGNGIAVSFSGGYDWWLGPELSAGFAGNVDIGVTTGSSAVQIERLELRADESDFLFKAGLRAFVTYF